MPEIKWSVDGKWLTGNPFESQGLTYQQAQREFAGMKPNPAVASLRLVRHVTRTAVMKEYKRQNRNPSRGSRTV